mmetsp:Transcript_6374/g.9273  ORF Transcript_6374/g.9273 Transcript_6374/m.9273 type:complete len:262 (+) Transcript_6374:101-886(+)
MAAAISAATSSGVADAVLDRDRTDWDAEQGPMARGLLTLSPRGRVSGTGSASSSVSKPDATACGTRGGAGPGATARAGAGAGAGARAGAGGDAAQAGMPSAVCCGWRVARMFVLSSRTSSAASEGSLKSRSLESRVADASVRKRVIEPLDPAAESSNSPDTEAANDDTPPDSQVLLRPLLLVPALALPEQRCLNNSSSLFSLRSASVCSSASASASSWGRDVRPLRARWRWRCEWRCGCLPRACSMKLLASTDDLGVRSTK